MRQRWSLVFLLLFAAAHGIKFICPPTTTNVTDFAPFHVPTPYSTGLPCTWLIDGTTSPVGVRVIPEILPGDYIEFFDGATASAPRLAKIYGSEDCVGDSTGSGNVCHRYEFQGSQHYMFVQMTTFVWGDFYPPMNGLTVDPYLGSVLSFCTNTTTPTVYAPVGGAENFVEDPYDGSLSAGGNIYLAGVCSWQIYTNGTGIAFQVNYLRMQIGDYLSIYDGNTTAAPLLVRAFGAGPYSVVTVPIIWSNSSWIFVVRTALPGTKIGGGGFQIRFKGYQRPVLCPPLTKVNASMALTFSYPKPPSTPDPYDYPLPPGLYCEFLLEAPVGWALDVSNNYPSVCDSHPRPMVYDGNSTADPPFNFDIYQYSKESNTNQLLMIVRGSSPNSRVVDYCLDLYAPVPAPPMCNGTRQVVLANSTTYLRPNVATSNYHWPNMLCEYLIVPSPGYNATLQLETVEFSAGDSVGVFDYDSNGVATLLDQIDGPINYNGVNLFKNYVYNAACGRLLLRYQTGSDPAKTNSFQFSVRQYRATASVCLGITTFIAPYMFAFPSYDTFEPIPFGTNCTWLARAPGASAIIMYFNSGKPWSLPAGVLTIYDGSTTSSPILWGNGYIPNSGTFYTSGPYMLFSITYLTPPNATESPATAVGMQINSLLVNPSDACAPVTVMSASAPSFTQTKSFLPPSGECRFYTNSSATNFHYQISAFGQGATVYDGNSTDAPVISNDLGGAVCANSGYALIVYRPIANNRPRGGYWCQQVYLTINRQLGRALPNATCSPRNQTLFNTCYLTVAGPVPGFNTIVAQRYGYTTCQQTYYQRNASTYFMAQMEDFSFLGNASLSIYDGDSPNAPLVVSFNSSSIRPSIYADKPVYIFRGAVTLVMRGADPGQPVSWGYQFHVYVKYYVTPCSGVKSVQTYSGTRDSITTTPVNVANGWYAKLGHTCDFTIQAPIGYIIYIQPTIGSFANATAFDGLTENAPQLPFLGRRVLGASGGFVASGSVMMIRFRVTAEGYTFNPMYSFYPQYRYPYFPNNFVCSPFSIIQVTRLQDTATSPINFDMNGNNQYTTGLRCRIVLVPPIGSSLSLTISIALEASVDTLSATTTNGVVFNFPQSYYGVIDSGCGNVTIDLAIGNASMPFRSGIELYWQATVQQSLTDGYCGGLAPYNAPCPGGYVADNATYLYYRQCSVVLGDLNVIWQYGLLEFPNLVAVSGTLFVDLIEGNVTFPALQSASQLMLGTCQTFAKTNFPLSSMNFPALTLVSSLSLCTSIAATVQMPLLTGVPQTSSGAGYGVRKFLMPSLVTIYALGFSSPFLQVLDLSSLRTASSGFTLDSADVFTNLTLPSFQTTEYFTVTNCKALRTISLPSLVYVLYMTQISIVLSLVNLNLPFLACTTLNLDSTGLQRLVLYPTQQITTITVSNNNDLTRIDAGAVNTTLNIIGNYVLDTIVATTYRGPAFTLRNSKVTSLSLPSFTRGTLIIADNLILSLVSLPSVTSLTTAELSRSLVKDFSAPLLTSLGKLTLTSNPSLSRLDLCALRSAGSVTVSLCPLLSCADLSAFFDGMMDTSRGRPTNLTAIAPDCSRTAIGMFGCAFDVTLVVNTTKCGYTLACIQETIDLALSNQSNIVLIPGGTYTGCSSPLTAGGKIITVSGAGMGVTVTDCKGSGRGLLAENEEGSLTEFRQMSFVNGSADCGGNALFTASASPTLRQVSFDRGSALSSGGALAITRNAAPTFIDCHVTNSLAGDMGGGIYILSASMTLSGTLISGCSASEGGGVAIQTSTGASTSVLSIPSLIEDSVIRGNGAARGGGLYSTVALTLRKTLVTGNIATQFGGGLAAVPIADLGTNYTLWNCTFSANQASGGAGIFSFSANLDMGRVQLLGNLAGTSGGGGLSATCSQDYRVLSGIVQPCAAVVRFWNGSRAVGNTALGNGGGVLSQEIALFLEDSTLDSNSAGGGGGGVYSTVTYLTADSMVWYQNRAAYGGGLYCEPFTGACAIVDSYLSDNSAVQAGGGIYLCTSDCPQTAETLPNFALVPRPDRDGNNVFVANQLGASGYGADVGADPSQLQLSSTPLATIVSGDAITADSAALSVAVQDALGQTVTTSAQVLTLTLGVLHPDGRSADGEVQVGGTLTALAVNGVAQFGVITLTARNVSGMGATYYLACNLTEVNGVSTFAAIYLAACPPGRGRTDAGGVAACDSCTAGAASSDQTDFVCVACPAGSVAERTGSGTCSVCAANTYAPLAGGVTCVACPEGQTAPPGSAACVADGALSGLSGVAIGGIVGGIMAACVLAICILAACLYRAARRRTMQKYYLDNDATVRTGAAETPLQKDVKRILLASSTTRIGGGMYSNVYKAKYEEAYIALKVIKGEMATNGTAQQEFRREAVALSRLEDRKHPGIISLRFFLNFNPMCIGVGFCHGGSLKRAIQTGQITALVDKTRIVTEAASALSVVHACNVVHLDIKTDNMLLSGEGRVIVADFGISRLLGTSEDPEELLPDQYVHSTGSSSPSHATGSSEKVKIRTNTDAFDTAFTPQYVDPIRILVDKNDDEPYLRTADVFSFGVFMWAVFSGEEPYAGENPNDLVERLKINPMLRPPPIPYCPPTIASLMAHCWDATPTMRPTFVEVFETLRTHLLEVYGVTLTDGYKSPDHTPAGSADGTSRSPSTSRAPELDTYRNETMRDSLYVSGEYPPLSSIPPALPPRPAELLEAPSEADAKLL